MKLHKFLTQNNISMGKFAKSVGTTTATISRIADGSVVPRKALMERIFVVTDGNVTPNDLVDLVQLKPATSVRKKCSKK